MKKNIIILLFIIFVYFLTSASEASFYLAGTGGASYSAERKEATSFSLYTGYNFPLLVPLKAEIAVRKMGRDSLIGGGGRITLFPFFNMSAGVTQKINGAKDQGIYIGPGINFNLLPKIDLLADGHLIFLENKTIMTAEVGIRYFLF